MAIVIYSARTGRLRRIISDDIRTDEDLLATFPVGIGEAVIPNITGVLTNIPDIQERVSTLTGLVPSNDRYVVVDPANDHEVEAAYILDTDCGDSIEGKTLVVDATADIGYRHMPNGSFQRSTRHINQDIATRTGLFAMYNSKQWRRRMLADGMTNPEVNLEKARLVDEVNAALAQLDLELVVREGARI